MLNGAHVSTSAAAPRAGPPASMAFYLSPSTVASVCIPLSIYLAGAAQRILQWPPWPLDPWWCSHDYTTLHGKRDLADVIKIPGHLTLRMEITWVGLT